MAKIEKFSKGVDRTRRNLLKAGTKFGAVAGAAALASLAGAKTAMANDDERENWFRKWWHHHHHHRHDKDSGDSQCFLKGTTIKTVNGDCKVEDLAAGDLLPTMFGGDCAIQWIGRYSFKKTDSSKPWVSDVLPVRIARSALAPEVPSADLYVSQAHAVFFDGLLVPAGCLINGTTIERYESRDLDELEYYHIKLENHDVIYAEGAPCETLREVAESASNFAEYFRNFGVPAFKLAPCVPLQTFNGGRSEIKSRLRSALSPWIDLREKIDVVRDTLEERAASLSL